MARQLLLPGLLAAGLGLAAGGARADDLLYSSPQSGTMQLYRLADGASTGQQLTRGPGDSDNAVWSPDGRMVAFVSKREGNPQVFVMNADGAQQRRISGASELSANPQWSADGQRLLYTAFRGGVQHVLSSELAGNRETVIARLPEGAANLAWSPDGSRVAFSRMVASRQTNLFMLDTRSGEVTHFLVNKDSTDSRPLWSPDGRQIAFMRTGGRSGTNLFVVNADGSGLRQLTKTIYYSFAHSWSPDGRSLAYVSNSEAGDRNDIFVLDVASGQSRNLTRHPHEDIDPAWSDDGRSLVFVSYRSGTSQLYRVTLDGQVSKLTLGNAYEGTPLPRPRAGAAQITAQSATTPNRGN